MCIVFLYGCKFKKEYTPDIPEENFVYNPDDLDVFRKLSDFAMFKEPLAAMNPVDGVMPYDLNSSLFSDYALKKRFIYLPPGTSMAYHSSEAFSFPEGSIIFKFFYYPDDFRAKNSEYKIIETRLLIKKNDDWQALTYIWNESQTDAELAIAGDTKFVSWIDINGLTRKIDYSIPNLIQCKSCHDVSGEMVPIGPAARHLNKNYTYSDKNINQLTFFNTIGWLTGMEALENCPKLADYEDSTNASLDQRARAYLEINCAHCHRPDGPARNSGLNLLVSESNPLLFGVFKTPVAAGRGSGGLSFDIVPGNAEASILSFRMESLEPGIMMPELGRKLVHDEGLKLIKDWINEMEE